jgi:hypothetical protein
VSQDLFDVPVLGEIASILLDVVRSDEDFALSRVLARAESVEMGERIVELQRVGEAKGNYPSRFVAALDVLRGRQNRSGDVRTNEADGQAKTPPVTGGPLGRQHPHSIGIR